MWPRAICVRRTVDIPAAVAVTDHLREARLQVENILQRALLDAVAVAVVDVGDSAHAQQAICAIPHIAVHAV